MKDFEQKIYKGCTIDKLPHPKLTGTYEVHDKTDKFIGRYSTIKESKEAINRSQKQ